MDGKKTVLDNMSPMQIFVFGVVEGILILCTIGFFIMISGGGLPEFGAKEGRTARVVDTGNTAPTGAAAGGEIAIAEVDTENDHIRGNKNAKISIVEYSDFQCPFCGRFHETMAQVMDKYGDDVNWVYRHFPLESIHPQARLAAVGSECAAEQGKFWEFADAAFENQQSLSGGLDIVATAAGVKNAAFDTCVNSGKYDDVVSADSRDAQAAGGRGTPYSIIVTEDGKMIPINGAQPFSQVDATLAQLL